MDTSDFQQNQTELHIVKNQRFETNQLGDLNKQDHDGDEYQNEPRERESSVTEEKDNYNNYNNLAFVKDVPAPDDGAAAASIPVNNDILEDEVHREAFNSSGSRGELEQYRLISDRAKITNNYESEQSTTEKAINEYESNSDRYVTDSATILQLQ